MRGIFFFLEEYVYMENELRGFIRSMFLNIEDLVGNNYFFVCVLIIEAEFII